MANKNQDNESIVWQAPEFEYAVKDISWHWLSLIAAAILLILALWQKNFLFAVFVIIAEAVVFFSANRFPPIWEFKIDKDGVSIGEKLYPFKEINSFDIHPADEEYKELVLKLKSKLSPYLKINIFAEDELKISELLLKFLPREEIEVSISDVLSKFIKF